MNTCESVSKQRTLTSFRMNTCEKRGRGPYTSFSKPKPMVATSAPRRDGSVTEGLSLIREGNLCAKESLGISVNKPALLLHDLVGSDFAVADENNAVRMLRNVVFVGNQD